MFISVLLLSLQQQFLFPCLHFWTAGTRNIFSWLTSEVLRPLC